MSQKNSTITNTHTTLCKIKCPSSQDNIKCEYFDDKGTKLYDIDNFGEGQLTLTNLTSGQNFTECNKMRSVISECLKNGFGRGKEDVYICNTTNISGKEISLTNLITSCSKGFTKNNTLSTTEEMCPKDYTFGAIFFQEPFENHFTPIIIVSIILIIIFTIFGVVLFKKRRSRN